MFLRKCFIYFNGIKIMLRRIVASWIFQAPKWSFWGSGPKKFYCNCFTLKNLSSCWRSARTKQVFVVYFGGSALGAVHNWRHANLDFFWPPFPLCHTQMPQPFCTCATKRLNPSPSLRDVIYEWSLSFLYKNIHFYRTKETKNRKNEIKNRRERSNFVSYLSLKSGEAPDP